VLAPEPPVTKSDAAPTVAEKGASKQKKSSSKKKRRKGPSRGGRATGQNGEDEDEDDYNPSDSGLRDSDGLQADEDEDFEAAEDLDANTTKGTGGTVDSTAKVHVKVERNEQDPPQTRPTTSVLPTESSHVEDTGPVIPIVVDDDDEEPKPKLALDLKYQAFPNFNRCLCVVVEPWPPRPPQTSGSYSWAPSLAPSTASRAPSVAPTISEFSTNRGQRARTPLFLPDLDDDSRFRTLPPVPLFDDGPSSISRDSDVDDMEVEWDGSTSLMQFSQMLSATGRVGGTDVEEEDEFDGTALFADADEGREL